MKLSTPFRSLRSKLAALLVLGLAALFPAVSSIAAGTVRLDGALGVANVSTGQTTYTGSTNASFDQVVKYQVYYHNTELPDSGKIAQNLRVKVALPTAPGTTQTATATISADNANTVTDTAVVNLNRADAYLQYIPGSAVWRHNTGTDAAPVWTEAKIGDEVVTGGTGLVLENEKPCFNFSATVTVLARVIVPGVEVTKEVRVKGTTNWSTAITAKAGESVEYLIGYKNAGNAQQDNVVIADKLPTNVTYVPGTTQVKNAYWNGVYTTVADGVTAGGIDIGSYTPGSNAYVKFEAKLPAEDKLACGSNLLRNTATAQPKGMSYYYNTADVTVTKDCAAKTPAVTIDKKVDGVETKEVAVGQNFTYQLVVKNTGEVDLTNVVVTDKAPAGVTLVSADKGSVSGNNWTYTLPSLKVGQSATVNITAKVAAYVEGSLVNTACVNAPEVNPSEPTKDDDCDDATVTVKQPIVPEYACKAIVLTAGTNRTVTARVEYLEKNAKLKLVTYNWGDSSTPLVTDKTTASYQYGRDGTFTVSVKLLFSVDGTDKYAAENTACARTVTFTSPTQPGTTTTTPMPTVLPNTGAGSVIGLFGLVTVVSALVARLFLSRRLAR